MQQGTGVCGGRRSCGLPPIATGRLGKSELQQQRTINVSVVYHYRWSPVALLNSLNDSSQ